MGQDFVSLVEVKRAVLNPDGPFPLVKKKEDDESHACWPNSLEDCNLAKDQQEDKP
jgi:hypothetical protein